MRLVIATAGKWKSGPERDLYDHYAKRITFALDHKEIEEKKKRAPAALKVREGELLLAQVPDGAVIVALHEGGKTLSSKAFAEKLGVWRDEARDVAFLIGGADGLDGAVRRRADLILGLGAMTWPHLMVRGMLAEQIYRAQCILARHPYHRG